MQEENKENVYGEVSGTEQTEKEVARTVEDTAQEGSTVPKKFRDVDALVRAYESLQAEFTRRSQRLKELEKAAENFAAKEKRTEGSGAEKLRKNSEVRRREKEAFDAFIADTGASFSAKKAVKPDAEAALPERISAVRFEKEDEETSAAKEEEQPKADAPADSEALAAASVENAKRSAAESDGESADALFEKASRDEAVRLRIIGEYLASLGKSGAPLTTGGAGTITAPPKQIRSIGDAGNMALSYFKKPFEG